MGTFLILSAIIVLVGIAIIGLIFWGTKKKTTPKNTKNITPAIPSTKKKTSLWTILGYIASILAIILLIVLIAWGISSIFDSCSRKKPQTERTPQIHQPTETTYLFSDFPDGKITIYLDLSNGASWKVLGGKIKILTPNRDIWDDEPGVNYSRPKTRSGSFTFWADPENPGAWGIIIIKP